MIDVNEMPPLLTWWAEVNRHLAAAGKPEMLFGDARYWHGRRHSPNTTARLHIEEMEG